MRRPRSSGRVTLAEVAQAAGVSPITVSRALRGDRNVAPELTERVRAAAAALRYVPDPAAQMLASSRSRTVVALLPLLTNHVFADLLEALQRTLLAAGYQTLFAVTHYNALEEERLLQSYVGQRPAGVLLTGSGQTAASRGLLAASGLPCVHLMETEAPEGGWAVGFSQFEAGRAMARHLIGTGRRQVAFVAGQLDPRVMQRAAGWRAALEEAGLPCDALEVLDPRTTSLALGGELFQALLARRPEVDAVFFCNDDLAQGALLTALRLGIQVPQRVAIAGFNDLEGSAQMLPALTTVRTPRAAIGVHAADLLIELLQGRTPASRSVDLGFEIVRRESA